MINGCTGTEVDHHNTISVFPTVVDLMYAAALVSYFLEVRRSPFIFAGTADPYDCILIQRDDVAERTQSNQPRTL